LALGFAGAFFFGAALAGMDFAVIAGAFFFATGLLRAAFFGAALSGFLASLFFAPVGFFLVSLLVAIGAV
jgi:hypothetical protein